MRRSLSLVLFLILTVGGGLLIGTLTLPDAWYAALAKPPWTPPGWVFGPAWTLLYVLIALAGYRTWRRAPSGPAMQLWAGQMLLNFSWSPIFFRAHLIEAALVVIAGLLLVIVAFIARSWRSDRVAAWMFVPYALWVVFALSLNAGISWLN
jgi:tryptophan-rich sensory protein